MQGVRHRLELHDPCGGECGENGGLDRVESSGPQCCVQAVRRRNRAHPFLDVCIKGGREGGSQLRMCSSLFNLAK